MLYTGCEYCGKIRRASRAETKTCSNSCRQALYRCRKHNHHTLVELIELQNEEMKNHFQGLSTNNSEEEKQPISYYQPETENKYGSDEYYKKLNSIKINLKNV